MARAHFVKKARKDGPEGSGVKKGDSYYWWAFMVGGRGGPKRYSKTPPKASQLTQSEFLGTLGDIADEIGALPADDSLEQSVADIAQRVRELGEETSSKKDNLPDSLQNGAPGEQLQERADKCESIADELENITFDVSDKADDQTEDDYWQEKLDEVQAVDASAP